LNSKLTFERKHLAKHPKVSSVDRTYIDFIINGISLTELLVGGVGYNIGKFGWKTNIDFEISEFNDFQIGVKSRRENGFFSAYVCAECGDEGCGAVMFRIEKTENTIKWIDFVWSDGYPESEDEPDEKIDIEPIIFDNKEYRIALSELKKMITEK